MVIIWKSVNDWLNGYGGFIGAVSLLLSVFIYAKTGQIKNNIKNLLNHENYEKRKKQTKKKLEGILESVNKDDIFDVMILGEISREIAALEHYSIFFDRRTKKNINLLKKQLNKEFSQIAKEKHKLISLINKVIGDLEIMETYLG